MLVGDLKYKRVNVEGVKHPDLYQLLAYATAAYVLFRVFEAEGRRRASLETF